MRKILATGIATILFAAFAVPASAGNIYFGFGGGNGWGHHGWNSDAGVYIDVPVHVQPQPQYYGGGGDAHVAWCDNQYQTYDPYTDLYFYAPGKQKHCNSPYN